MAAPPLADPPLPELMPGGTGAPSAAAPRLTTEAAQAAGSTRAATDDHARPTSAGDDAVEHGWTGLGLPAYEPPAPPRPPHEAITVARVIDVEAAAPSVAATPTSEPPAPNHEDSPSTQRDSPARQGNGPQKQDVDPAKKGDDSQKQDVTSAKKGDGPQKQDVRAAKKADAPQKQDVEPAKKGDAPQKQGVEPAKKGDGPKKQGVEPATKADAPQKQDVASAKKTDAPQKQDVASAKKTDAPQKQDVASAKKGDAPQKQDVEPAKKADASPKEAPAAASGTKTGASALRAQSLPPRPTGTSGAFAAVRAPTPAPPEATTGRASEPAPAPAPAPRPEPARSSKPAPEPAPTRGPDGGRGHSAHGRVDEGGGTARPPSPAAARPASPPPPAPPPAPAADESDVTIDEEDLGATIPEYRTFDDLTATVPMLPHATHAPSFGFPPPDPALAAPTHAAPAAHAAPTFGLPAADARASHPHAPPDPQDPHDARASLPRVAIAPPADAAPLPAEPDSETGPPPYGPGAIIGEKYRLIRVIGRGGMGAVWIAHNTALDVEVAIKLMRRDRATPEAAARFTTEARAAARLGHPSIVRVFDFGETSRGDPFIVMELLHGESFGALLKRKGKLKPTVAVQTLLPVAHALSAAHAKGIVHRDLKPDNILLARDESNVVTPKVVDFGIAKLSADVDRHFTIAGEVLGSPDYMSPEQARGEDDIDHRTDIWTFSVLLYEAISGKRPFDGSNYNALLASIIASRPAPLADRGISEPALWTIIEKGLHKERDGRCQSVPELGMELAGCALERGAEHDLAGASLSAQWLEPTRRRLFTVAGTAPPPDPAALAEPTIPKPPPLGKLAADVPRPEAPAIAHTMPPFVPRRRPWIAAVIGVACLVLLAFGLLAGGVFHGPPEPAASVPTAPTTSAAAPTTTLTEQPTAQPTPPSATTSAKPAASTKRPAPTGTFKPKGPRVKGDITF